MLQLLYVKADKTTQISVVEYFSEHNNFFNEYQVINEDIMLLSFAFPTFHEEIDFHDLYHDFNNPNVIFYYTIEYLALNNQATIIDYLSLVKGGFYKTSSLLQYYLITNQNHQFINNFNSYLMTLDKELVESIFIYLRYDLNVLKTAQVMYLHRNSLNYRLRLFSYLTGLNVRHLSDASIMQYFKLINKPFYKKQRSKL